MVKERIFDVLNDQHQFLKYYLKDNLPHSFYRRAFKKKINQVQATNHFTFSTEASQAIHAYWKPYEKISLVWHEAYTAISDIWDERYIPEDVFYKKIEPKLNRFELALTYADKNMSDQLFSAFKMPKTILRNMNGNFHDVHYNKLTLEEASEWLQTVGATSKFVIKPSIDTGAGKNVRVVDLRGKSTAEIKQAVVGLFHHYQKDFIVQEFLEQHALFKKMHEDSLNTIRIISLRLEDEIFILSSVVRMGDNGNHVDNGVASCITCGIDSQSKLKSHAINHWTYEKYTAHPYSQFVFADTTIPSMKECHDLVKKAHEKLYYFDLVSWDLAIDHLGEPHLIEIGVQLQDINYHQRANGPLFKEFTEKVLKKVYSP